MSTRYKERDSTMCKRPRPTSVTYTRPGTGPARRPRVARTSMARPRSRLRRSRTTCLRPWERGWTTGTRP